MSVDSTYSVGISSRLADGFRTYLESHRDELRVDDAYRRDRAPRDRISEGLIHAGIAVGMKQMAERGWEADLCLVRPETATIAVERQLAKASYDCVVIGGGIRIPPKSLLLFETLVNAVHRSAPNATIAFNTSPQDTADAAARRFTAE